MSEPALNHSSAPLPSLLVVDDERPLADFVREALEGVFSVETAHNTSEADTQLGLQKFDLVLADHLMPGETGLEFLMRCKTHFPAMKRVLMTGYLNPDLISRAQTLANLSGYLIKPINISQLRTAVLGALAH